MGDNYQTPTPGDMYDNAQWGKFYGNAMKNVGGALRTSAGASGGAQYVATSTSISDILQGTFNFRNPSEIASTLNIGLTRQLQQLDTPGLLGLSLLGGDRTKDGRLSVGADGNPNSGGGGGNAPSDLDPTQPETGATSAAAMKYAGQLLVDHPNFWTDTEDVDSSGKYAKSLREQLLNGFNFSAEDASNVAVKEGNKGFIAPNLLNLMYYIVDNGFILGRTSGMAGGKNSKSGKRSNHSHGGAIDIHRIGRASENVTYEITDTQHSDSIVRELYALIDLLPPSRFPSEIGGPFDPGNGKKGDAYYTDGDHKNHLHLGYSPGKSGSLYSQLLPSDFNSGVIDSGGGQF